MKLNTISGKEQNILDAALKLFISQGYSNVTLENIAHAVGYSSKGTVYKYFKGLDGILDKLVTPVVDAILKRIEELEASESGPIDAITNLVSFLIEAKFDYPDQLELTIDQWICLSGKQRNVFTKKRSKILAFIKKQIQKGNESGVFQVKDTTTASLMVMHSVRWVHDKGPAKRKSANRVIVKSYVLDMVMLNLTIGSASHLQRVG